MYSSVGYLQREFYSRHHREHYSLGLQLLCRTLVENRTLARHIEEFRQHIDYVTVDIAVPLNSSWRSDQVRRVPHKDATLARGTANWLISLAVAGSMTDEVCICIVIAICPNIKRLALFGTLDSLKGLHPFTNTVHFIASAKGETDTSISYTAGFYGLRHVHLECDSVGGSVSVANISTMLRLPSLSKLSVFGLSSNLSDSPSRDIDKPCGLQELSILQCSAKISSLQCFLPRCRFLKSLALRWTSRVDNYNNQHLNSLGDLLRQNCLLLEHLSLDHPPDGMFDDDRFRQISRRVIETVGYPAGMGPITDFKQLKALKLSNVALFGSKREYAAQNRGLYSGRTKVDIETLLPEFLEELTILCEDTYLTSDDLEIFEDPGAGRFGHRLKLMNCQQDRWATSVDGVIVHGSQVLVPSSTTNTSIDPEDLAKKTLKNTLTSLSQTSLNALRDAIQRQGADQVMSEILDLHQPTIRR